MEACLRPPRTLSNNQTKQRNPEHFLASRGVGRSSTSNLPSQSSTSPSAHGADHARHLRRRLSLTPLRDGNGAIPPHAVSHLPGSSRARARPALDPARAAADLPPPARSGHRRTRPAGQHIGQHRPRLYERHQQSRPHPDGTRRGHRPGRSGEGIGRCRHGSPDRAQPADPATQFSADLQRAHQRRCSAAASTSRHQQSKPDARAGREISGAKSAGNASSNSAAVGTNGPLAPPNVPNGAAYSPSRGMWRDADGNLFDQQGKPVP